MSRSYYDNRGRTLDFGGIQGPPADIKVLLIVLFVLFVAAFIPPLQPLIKLLYLSPLVLSKGYFWQLLTYIVAPETNGLWFLLTLLLLFLFGRDVFRMLGRKRFWRMLLAAVLAGSTVAVGVHSLMQVFGLRWTTTPFVILHGSELLFTIMVAAFGTIYPNATIRLMFILPIRARSFLWIEILIAFVFWFLPTWDLAGFLGVCAAVGMTFAILTGGVGRNLRELRLRIERWLIARRLQRMKKKSGFRVVKPDEGGDVKRGPWVH